MVNSESEFYESLHKLKYGLKSIQTDTYSLEVNYDWKKHLVEQYDSKISVVRRGTTLEINLNAKSHDIKPEEIKVKLETKRSNFKTYIELEHGKILNEYFDVNISKREKTHEILLKISEKAPIGMFEVSVTAKNKINTDSIPFFIVFNPLCKNDPTFCDNQELIENYLLHKSTKIHYGNWYSNGHKSYKLEQYSLECMAIANIYLGKMKIHQRTNPILVSRAITSFVNSIDNNGLLAGNWGKIESGTSPSEWVNMKDIFIEYLKERRPVEWGQCFVFAGLVTSLCRNIGILCRAISGFSIGHDDNKDGKITIYVEEDTMKNLRDSETLWNFHCWNNCWIKRDDLSLFLENSETPKDNWQHIDGTPQETSEGIYQCGPFPVSLLRNHVYQAVQYDGDSVYYSINAVTKYVVMNKKNEVVNEYEKYNAGKLILTSDKKNPKINITDEYKAKKIKPVISEENKVDIEIQVPESVSLNTEFPFKLKILNSSHNSKTVVCVVLQIRNLHGKNMDESRYQSFVFEEKNKEIQATFNLNISNLNFDLSSCYVHWDVRFFDSALNHVKYKTRYSNIASIVSGDIKKSGDSWSRRLSKVEINVKNEMPFPLKNIKIVAYADNNLSNKQEIVRDFKANENYKCYFEFDNLFIGYHKIKAYVQSNFVHHELGVVKSFVNI